VLQCVAVCSYVLFEGLCDVDGLFRLSLFQKGSLFKKLFHMSFGGGLFYESCYRSLL